MSIPLSAVNDLLAAARMYTRYKVLDGIVPVPGGEDVMNPISGPRAVNAVRSAGGTAMAVAALEWTPLLYCYFRRWMTAEGAEAIAGECSEVTALHRNNVM